mmetsp:Transcript_125980/g.268801  ORF Transcript_125980/g.268801 Transcript_125980/m.268801 type:complete len:371 (+) Transcript_125980:1069-2181(+)
MKDAEVGEAEGELLVASDAAIEHQEVSRAVHRLQHPFLLLNVQAVHVILILLIVPGGHEELGAVHVWRDHFRETTETVLAAHEFDELVVDPGACRVPEDGARGGPRVEVEELHLLPEVPVIALGSLLLEFLVVLQQLVAREGDAVEALQGVELLVAQPVGSRVPRDHESLGLARVRQVRPPAKVYEGPTAIAARESPIGHLVGDQLHLERVLLEELESVLFGQHAPFEGLLLFGNVCRMLFDGSEVILLELPLAEEAIVVEAGLQSRPDGQVAPELPLHSLAEDVRAGMPENVLALGMVELQQLQPAAALKRPAHIPKDAHLGARLCLIRLVVLDVCCDALLQGLDGLLVEHLSRHDGVRKALRDTLCDL